MRLRLPLILAALIAALFAADATAAGPIRSLFALRREHRTQPAPQAVLPTAPTPFIAPGPLIVGAAPVQGIGDRHAILTHIVREHAVRKLVKDGYNGKAVTREEARAMVEKIPDETIHSVGKIYGAPIGADVVQGAFIDWLIAHKDIIMQIVEMILKLLPLFLI